MGATSAKIARLLALHAWPYGCLVHVPRSSLYLGEDMSPRLKHDSLLLKSTPKRHLDRFSRFAGQVTNVTTQTDRQTDVCSSRPHLRCGLVISGDGRCKRQQQQTHSSGRLAWFGGLWPPGAESAPQSTQLCILPGSLNRVPPSAGMRARMSPLPGGG